MFPMSNTSSHPLWKHLERRLDLTHDDGAKINLDMNFEFSIGFIKLLAIFRWFLLCVGVELGVK